LIQINEVIPDSVQNLNHHVFIKGVSKIMSSLEKSNDSEAETLRNMGINIAVIFGVIAALIVVSIYFAGTPN
jgi:ABC-type sulfate transport system permease subunit